MNMTELFIIDFWHKEKGALFESYSKGQKRVNVAKNYIYSYFFALPLKVVSKCAFNFK